MNATEHMQKACKDTVKRSREPPATLPSHRQLQLLLSVAQKPFYTHKRKIKRKRDATSQRLDATT